MAVALAAFLPLMDGSANAALHDRGGGLIYDDVLDVTWLSDANFARTSGYDSDGLMSWLSAKNWAEGLVFYDPVRKVSYDDWRLPGMSDTGGAGCDYAFANTDCGYNVQTVGENSVYSELAHMYYNSLGLKGLRSPTGDVPSDWGIFEDGSSSGGERDGVGPGGVIQNLQSSEPYWSGSLYRPPMSDSAWFFDMRTGGQNYDFVGYEFYAWPLRAGDVAAVPEFHAYGMMLSGLALLGTVVARRHRLNQAFPAFLHAHDHRFG